MRLARFYLDGLRDRVPLVEQATIDPIVDSLPVVHRLEPQTIE
jgi:hypothetical protein